MYTNFDGLSNKESDSHKFKKTTNRKPHVKQAIAVHHLINLRKDSEYACFSLAGRGRA